MLPDARGQTGLFLALWGNQALTTDPSTTGMKAADPTVHRTAEDRGKDGSSVINNDTHAVSGTSKCDSK